MKKAFENELKKFLHDQLVQTRDSVALSQEKMAPYLEVSTKALRNVECGNSCFSLITFLFFCYRFCPDTEALMNDIFDIIRELEQK